jgi:mycothiol synthase
LGLVWKSIDAADTPAWSELTNLLAVQDGTDEVYAPEDLAEELEEPGFDPALDSIALWDGGTMVGFGQLRVMDALRDGVAKANISGGVREAYRGRKIGRELMDRMEARARQLTQDRHPSAPAAVEIWAGRPGSGATRLAAARGYEPVRYFQDMRVELDAWAAPADAAAPGTPTVTFAQEFHEATRLAHNEAFEDHWGSTARSPEKWRDQLRSRSFRAAYSRLILNPDPTAGPDDAVDSYLLSGEWVPGELYVSLVGTRRRARGRGHAARLLADVVGAAKEAGYRTVDLGVDSESPTGAVGLYERVGFRKIRTNVVYSRSL